MEAAVDISHEVKKSNARKKGKAAGSSLSSLQRKMETAYTTASNWAEFTKAEESVITHFYQTQTDEPLLGALVAQYATNTASNARESFESVLQAHQTGVTGKAVERVAKEAQKTILTYIATQTYLADGVKKSMQSDWNLRSKLVQNIRIDGNGNGNGRISCVVEGVLSGVIVLVVLL